MLSAVYDASHRAFVFGFASTHCTQALFSAAAAEIQSGSFSSVVMLSASFVSGHVTQTLFTTSLFDLAAYPHPSYHVAFGTNASFKLHLNDAGDVRDERDRAVLRDRLPE